MLGRARKACTGHNELSGEEKREIQEARGQHVEGRRIDTIDERLGGPLYVFPLDKLKGPIGLNHQEKG